MRNNYGHVSVIVYCTLDVMQNHRYGVYKIYGRIKGIRDHAVVFNDLNLFGNKQGLK